MNPATRSAVDRDAATGSPAGRIRRFTVEGLCCASEARLIEAKLGSVPGVADLRINPVQHTVEIRGEIETEAVEGAMADLGLTARLVEPSGRGRGAPGATSGATSGRSAESGPDQDRSAHRARRARLFLSILSGVFWIASMAAGRWTDSEIATALLAVASVAAGGRYVFPRGARAVLNRALDMNFLMSAAAVGALLIGEYAEAASVMFLFAVAQLLERASMDRARNAIRSLMELAPAQARVLRSGREELVPAEDVAVGEHVVVRPGEKVPVDGVVLAGRSAVDQSPITGESLPVDKEPGGEVFAGTLNGEGALEIRSAKAPADTTLARIIHSVEEAQASRAPSQAFVERFARIYTPAVVGAAVLVAVVPPLVFGALWGEWFYRALALLVIACPCALVISTPVTVVSALAGAARRGILIKGGVHLERAGRARVVAMDKTGTLTEGRPVVEEVFSFDGADPSRILALAAAVEGRSEHPLARAIRERAREAGVAVSPAEETKALPGRGAEAWVDGRRIVVGSERLFAELGAGSSSRAGDGGRDSWATVRRSESRGRTVVLVGAAAAPESPASPGSPAPPGSSVPPGSSAPPGSPAFPGSTGERDDHDRTGLAPSILGAITLTDRIRSEARAAVSALRAEGVRQIVMLTGDNAATADAVGAELGGAEGAILVRSGLLPEGKAAAVRELRSRHGPVLMVGDGINDAPALATADAGVAMGVAGTDVALETADIALMADDLASLPVMIRLARKAEGIIRANIAFALLIKAVFVVGAVAGQVTLWMAVLADMGASLLVIVNGMRALRP